MRKKSNEIILLLEDFFDDYLPNIKGLSKNSIKSYQYAFQLLFNYLEEEKGLTPDKITFEILSGSTIDDFLFYLENERGCSVKTRNVRRSAIAVFAKYTAKKNFTASLPFYSTMIGSVRKREPQTNSIKHFTKEEISILLKLPDITKLIGQRDVTLMSLLYATGARAQEICDLTIGNITLGSPSKVRLIGKGNKSHFVAIPENCVSILKQYLLSRKLDIQCEHTQKRYLFSSQRNEHMSIACVESIVKKYVNEGKRLYPQLFKYGVYSPHSFRHSIAVHMLEAGESLVTIKAFLGHSSITTTCVYAKVTPELANKYLDERGKPMKDVSVPIDTHPLRQTLPFLYR